MADLFRVRAPWVADINWYWHWCPPFHPNGKAHNPLTAKCRYL